MNSLIKPILTRCLGQVIRFGRTVSDHVGGILKTRTMSTITFILRRGDSRCAMGAKNSHKSQIIYWSRVLRDNASMRPHNKVKNKWKKQLFSKMFFLGLETRGFQLVPIHSFFFTFVLLSLSRRTYRSQLHCNTVWVSISLCLLCENISMNMCTCERVRVWKMWETVYMNNNSDSQTAGDTLDFHFIFFRPRSHILVLTSPIHFDELIESLQSCWIHKSA